MAYVAWASGPDSPVCPLDGCRLRRGARARSAEVMVSERVRLVFRARTRGDNRALPRLEPLRLVAEATGPSGNEPERRWLVEVEVDLGGMNLDPEYWLRNCRNFLVDSESGEGVGVVDDVELASGSDRAVVLVVSAGWFGRHVRRIAVADVQAIVPSERRVIVTDAPRTAGARDGPA